MLPDSRSGGLPLTPIRTRSLPVASSGDSRDSIQGLGVKPHSKFTALDSSGVVEFPFQSVYLIDR